MLTPGDKFAEDGEIEIMNEKDDTPTVGALAAKTQSCFWWKHDTQLKISTHTTGMVIKL